MVIDVVKGIVEITNNVEPTECRNGENDKVYVSFRMQEDNKRIREKFKESKTFQRKQR